MPNVYFLGGFLGSELANVEGSRSLLWVNFSRLIRGEIGQMRLGPDGESPGIPDGQFLSAKGPLPLLYGGCLAIWRKQLQSAGLSSIEVGFDWRLAILRNGALLADRVRQEVSPDAPCALVGHSTGGLVARAAWLDLVRHGGANLVRRIVTLGTPHRGTYSPVTVFSLVNSALDQLNFLTTGARIVLSAVTFTPVGRSWTIPDLCRLVATWPCLYDLLPLVDRESEQFDPLRPYLFEVASWPADRGIALAQLTRARDETGAWLRSADSLPPPEILTTVTGRGSFTYSGLVDAGQIGSIDALRGSYEGDDTVTADSALIEGGPSYSLPARHNDLPFAAIGSGKLLDWVTERGSPSPPPPPTVPLPGPQLPRLTSPPMVQKFGPLVDCFR